MILLIIAAIMAFVFSISAGLLAYFMMQDDGDKSAPAGTPAAPHSALGAGDVSTKSALTATPLTPPAVFRLKDKAGRVMKKVPQTLAEHPNLNLAIRLVAAGQELSMRLSDKGHAFAEHPYFLEKKYQLLLDNDLNKMVIHAWHNMYVVDTTDHTVGVVFERQDDGGYLIRTGWNDHYIGYDSGNDHVRIVPKAEAVVWYTF